MSSPRRSKKSKRSSHLTAPLSAGRLSRALALSAFLLSAGTAAAKEINLAELNEKLKAGDAVIVSSDQIALSGDARSDILSHGHAISGDSASRDTALITAGGAGNLAVSADMLAIENALRVNTPDSEVNGGAVYASGDVSLTADSISLENNEVSGLLHAYGGAIYASGDVIISVGGGTLAAENNRARRSTSSQAYGGVIYAGYGDVSIDVSGGTLAVKGNSAEGGLGGAGGGAFYADRGSVDIAAASISFTDNVASSESDQQNASGGAIHANGSVRLRATQNITLSGDRALAQNGALGGAIHSGSGISIDVGGGMLTAAYNSAESSADVNYLSRGGALAAVSGSVDIAAASVDFHGNAVSSVTGAALGGAIYARSGSVTLSASDGVRLSGNWAKGAASYLNVMGGAVYAAGDVTISAGGAVSLTGNKLYDNQTTVSTDYIASGGAIAADKSVDITAASIELSGNVLSSDKNTARGGGLAAQGSVTLTARSGGDISITSNDLRGGANAYGGAVFAGGYISIGAEAGTVNVSGNTARAGNESALGGAMRSGSLDITARSIDISNNRAFTSATDQAANQAVNGGALFAESVVTLSADSIALSGNVASSDKTYAQGGAIYANDTATLRVSDSVVIKDNSVSGKRSGEIDVAGGAIYAPSVDIAAGKSILFSGNKALSGDAAGWGGAICGGAYNILLSADTVEFATSTDTLYIVGGGSMRLTAADLKVNGGGFALQKKHGTGTIDLTGVKQMTFGAFYASADRDARSADLFALSATAGSVDLRGVQALLSADVISAGVYDFMTVSADTTIGAVGAGYYRRQNGQVVSGDGSGRVFYSLSVDEFEKGTLLWTGADTHVWKNDLRYVDEWVRSNDLAASDDYYDGDSVIFGASGTRTVTVVGTVKPEKIDVTASGYSFTGSGDNAVISGASGDHSRALIVLAGGATSLNLENVAISNCDNGTGVSGGGALRAGSSLTVGISGGVAFEGNVLSADKSQLWGGAVCVEGGDLTFSGDAALAFSGNSVTAQNYAWGGAIYVSGGSLDVDAAALTMTGNTAAARSGGVFGGAIQASGGVTLTARSGDISFSDNSALAAAGNAEGGAIRSGGGVTLKAQSGGVSFSNNRAGSTSGSAKGGAVYTYGDISLSASNSVTLATSADTLYSKQGGITVSAGTFDVSRAAGGGMSAPLGTVTIARGTALNAQGTANAASLSDLFAIEAASVDFTGAQLTAAASGDFLALSGDVVSSGDNFGFDPSNLRNPSVTSSDLTGAAGWEKLTLKFSPLSLVWAGGNGTWSTGADRKLYWLDAASGASEDFYEDDGVTFGASGGAETAIAISGDVKPRDMAVAEGGNYVFSGGALGVTGALTINGTARFMDAVTANDVVLAQKGRARFDSGAAVAGSFTALSGSTLVVDGARAAVSAVLRGAAGATLTVKSGAALYVDNANPAEGDHSYSVAEGFADYSSLWGLGSIGASAYFSSARWSGGVLTLTVGAPVEPKLLSAGGTTALRVVGTFGGVLENRLSGLSLNDGSPAGRWLGQSNFLPAADTGAKQSAFWASMNYGRNRVDGLKIGGSVQDMDTKYYGVTVGYDRKLGRGAAGLALNLGNYDGGGKGGWDGAKNEGKYFGIGLYGGAALGRFDVLGSASVHWLKGDLENGAYSAADVNSRVFSLGAKAYYRAWESGALSVMPFVGVSWSRWGEDDYNVKQSGRQSYRNGSDSISQWSFPLGIRFDWARSGAQGGWSVRPSLEAAYVRAAGDLDYRSSTTSWGLRGPGYVTAVSDADNFRAVLSLEAGKDDFTLSVNLRGQWSAGQRDLGAALSGKWEF